MPVTPIHFGPGLAVKAALSRRFSLALFIALQVVIDLESLYNLVNGRHPVHRFLHTFLGATLLAALTALALLTTTRLWAPLAGTPSRPTKRLVAALLANTLFATWSHVVLDGIMHADSRPLWPLTDFNPLLGLISLRALHLACLLLGVLGLTTLGLQWSVRERDA